MADVLGLCRDVNEVYLVAHDVECIVESPRWTANYRCDRVVNVVLRLCLLLTLFVIWSTLTC